MSDKYSEQVFDYFASEMLDGPQPPDLTQRIVSAWREQLKTAGTTPKTVPLNAPASAKQPLVLAKPVSAPSTATLDAKRKPGRSQAGGQWIVPLLAISASLILAVLGWSVYQNVGDNSEASAIAEAEEEVPNAVDQKSIELKPRQDAAELAGHQPAVPQQELNLQDLPFGTDEPRSGDGQQRLKDRSKTASTLESERIVAEIDSRLTDIWNELNVSPSSPLSTPDLFAKVQRQLSGQSSASSVIPEDSTQFQLVQKITGTRQFAQHWANRLLEQWLGTNLAKEKDPAARALLSLAAAKIEQHEDWNQLVGFLLNAPVASQPNKNLASEYFVKTLAAGGKHRLVGRIGENFLNTNLTCSKCHDARLGLNGELYQSQPSAVALDLTGQAQYWSLVALLNGLEVRRNAETGSRELLDRQPVLFAEKNPSVFYDLPDGQLLSADAVLPDGKPWKELDSEAPRSALAQWISQSNLLDDAVVNQTWKTLFGRSLVPLVPATDVVAIKQRRALLDLLSKQYRDHDHDLGKLVQWIASTSAFSRSPMNLSREQWLESTEEEIQQLQLAEVVFASPTSLGASPDSRTLDDSLAMFRKWSGSNRLDNPQVTLAQPSLSPSKMDRKQTSVRLEMPSMSFVVHRDRPTVAELDFLDRLLDSTRLSWPEKVSHVVLLGDVSSVTSRNQQLATNLLDAHQGNGREALITLLWSIKNTAAN